MDCPSHSTILISAGLFLSAFFRCSVWPQNAFRTSLIISYIVDQMSEFGKVANKSLVPNGIASLLLLALIKDLQHKKQLRNPREPHMSPEALHHPSS